MRKIYDHQKTKYQHAAIDAFGDYMTVDSALAIPQQDIFVLFEEIKDSSYFKEWNGDARLQMTFANLEGKYWGLYHHETLAVYLAHDSADARILCHEVAHHLSYQQALDVPHHGPTFCTHFLNLIMLFADACDSELLRSCFEEHKVEYYFPRTVKAQQLRKSMGLV
ncbi:hypothetical protein [Pseudidiomarina terrestris]|uniref:hypothetical protein n=1 Tax=Pseudidiomarina terrestris TaxID=2820060 RepID=UPI0026556413|nr:hypothetical protein [Pseudidiomarina sp. 1ASP75-5]MDN7135370.1 hypothetical protein [Pseudidiomarina sp. 1ASP75-5]